MNYASSEETQAELQKIFSKLKKRNCLLEELSRQELFVLIKAFCGNLQLKTNRDENITNEALDILFYYDVLLTGDSPKDSIDTNNLIACAGRIIKLYKKYN